MVLAHWVIRLGLVVVAFAVGVSQVSAQDYRYCKDVDDDTVLCGTVVDGVDTPLQPTVARFAEGVVHASGSELAWIVVANWDAMPTVVTVRFLLQNPAPGHPALVTRGFTVPARTRWSFPVHADPELAEFRAFSTRVYVPGDLDVGLVMRPDGPNQFHDVVIHPTDVIRP